MPEHPAGEQLEKHTSPTTRTTHRDGSFRVRSPKADHSRDALSIAARRARVSTKRRAPCHRFWGQTQHETTRCRLRAEPLHSNYPAALAIREAAAHHLPQPPGEAPIIKALKIECVAGRGIRGDRFFDYQPDYKGQITFFSLEVFEALRKELGLPAAQLEATRRNVIVSGVDLDSLIGLQFELQGVRFAGVEESKPCYWMNSALGPGAEEWLRGRAGLRCRILTDGILKTECN